jgi:hypothetical protein
MKLTRPALPLLVALALGAPALGGGCAQKPIPLPQELPVESDALARLSKFRIYFGHQSVGENILDGVAGFAREGRGPRISVLETEDASKLAAGVWAHSKIGANEAPATKIAHFDRALRAGLAEAVDVAFMKLCYVDFDDPKLDVDQLFATYDKTMAGLEKDYPNLTLVHVTAPLTTVQTGAKAWLKKGMGKSVWGEAENARRNAFNEKLVARYSGKAPVFDLASWESRRGDGGRHTFDHEGKAVPALLPGFSDDGGHLNATGKRYVGGALLRFLGALDKRSRAEVDEDKRDETERDKAGHDHDHDHDHDEHGDHDHEDHRD